MTTFRDATPADQQAVNALLGRDAAGRFAVVVRRVDGRPVVIENEPHLRDGTPMPTLYWLVDRELHDAVSRIESSGGVHRFEALVDESALREAHERYAEQRTLATLHAELVQSSGGIGGTRVGVKCLHAHVANVLAGNVDPVGQLVVAEMTLPELRCESVR